MNKTNLKQISLISILGFGLISCSKENSGQLTKDNFNIEVPVIYAKFKSKGGASFTNPKAQRLDAKISEAIYPTSTIEMETLKGHNFSEDPIALNVTSSCQMPNGARSFQKLFSNVQSLQLLSLLDSNFIVELSLAQANVLCSMTFVFNNKIGSSHSFQFKDIPIAPLLKEEASQINLNSRDEQGKEIDPRLPIVFENTNNGVKFPLISQTQISYNSQVDTKLTLVCEYFSSQILAKSRSEISLSQFNSAKLIWQKRLPPSLSETDPRVAVPAQECRILFESIGTEHSVKFSRQFRLVYKNSDLKIAISINSKLFSNISKSGSILSGSSPEIFHLDIFNPSNIPVAVALSTVKMQVLANYDVGRLDYHEGFTRELSIIIEGGQFVAQDPSLGKVVSVQPRSHLTASYRLPFTSTCLFIREDMSIDIRNHNYAEIWARTLANLSIVQLANPIIDNFYYQPEYYKVYYQIENGSLPAAQWTTERAGNIYCDNFHQQI